MKGERRFIATIARRLDSLGAITRGQRDSQTAMGGSDAALFRESDNLESVYARAALRQFYGALWHGSIEGWNLERFEKATGLKLTWEGNLKEDLPPMPRFLNRLLALPIAEQNQLFAELESRIASNIEQAIEAGSYEVGVETVTADSLIVAGRETLYEHPGTGAATELVEIVRRDRLVPLTAESALEIGEVRPGSRRQAAPRGQRPLEARRRHPAGSLAHARRRRGDGAGPPHPARDGRDHGQGRARRLQLAPRRRGRVAPCVGRRDRRPAVAPGLPLLARHRPAAAGLGPPAGREHAGPAAHLAMTVIALIGRVLDAEQVRAVRQGFGLDGGPAMTGAEAFEAVMGRGNALALANGWRLARRRLMGADRIEIEGPADTDMDALKRMGCTVEIVQFRARIFAPNAGAIERILDRWPLAA